MTNPAFLTAKQAKEAFDAFVRPSIQFAMHKEHVNKSHMHVVVLQPGVPYSDDAELPILFEVSFGDQEDWDKWEGKSYKEFAYGKARLSWRTGLSSREVVLTKPHLLRPGDCGLWGSSVYGGVTTGISGVQPFFDEMFATMTSAAMVGEASYYADQFASQDDVPDFL
ncbi:hypothetical protein CL653_01880 [bacterium]|nr:hypothetical protein [bacterium]